MNVKGDANRSVQQTKRRLCGALVRLMGEKPLREITVRELTEAAGVSRGAFYFHYRDVDDLLAQIEQAHLGYLEGQMDALIPDLERGTVPPALEKLFTYLNENDDICRALYGPYSDLAFADHVKELLARRCMGRMAPAGGTPRQRYLMGFAVDGCFSTIQAWQAAGRDLPPRQIAAITWQAIRAVHRQF